MIPGYLRPFFWDVDADTFVPEAHPEYTIARLLELGDVEAVAWAKAHFSEAAIKAVIRSDRRLSRR